MKNRRTRYPARIGQILDGVFRQMNFTPHLMEAKVLSIWDDAVGEGVAKNAQPERLRGSTLHVTVTNSVWKQELYFMKGLIVDKVNARLGKKFIDSLSFRVGTVERRPREKTRPTPPMMVVLDDERVKIIEKDLKDITDAELKDAITALRMREERAKKRV